MERVLSKLDEISSLWSTLGSARDPDILNDKLQVSFALLFLFRLVLLSLLLPVFLSPQHVIFELDRLLEYEKLQRTFLAADIEDTMVYNPGGDYAVFRIVFWFAHSIYHSIQASIEESCNILGVSIENLMSSGLITGVSPIEIMPLLYHQPTPSITVYNALSTLDSRLSDVCMHAIFSVECLSRSYWLV